MPPLKRIQFSEFIAAPADRVSTLMTSHGGYEQWTTPFAEGSTFNGSWEQGQRIRFLAPGGDGMVAEIAEHRRGAFVSIRHIGVVKDGRDDTESEAARAWAPAYENYTFESVDGGTRVVVDIDVTDDWESFMRETWPRALGVLKALCESNA